MLSQFSTPETGLIWEHLSASVNTYEQVDRVIRGANRSDAAERVKGFIERYLDLTMIHSGELGGALIENALRNVRWREIVDQMVRERV